MSDRTIRIDTELDSLLKEIAEEQRITKREASRRVARITKETLQEKKKKGGIRWF